MWRAGPFDDRRPRSSFCLALQPVDSGARRGSGLHAEASAWVRKMVGDPQRIDQTFVGGEHIRVDDERSLQVLHVPGHSDGHLALYDPGNKAVFVGDALHGRYCPTTAGEPALPPGYYSVLAYLGTLQMLHAFDIDWIYSGHWPTYHGSQVSEFLTESRRFVDNAAASCLEDPRKASRRCYAAGLHG